MMYCPDTFLDGMTRFWTMLFLLTGSLVPATGRAGADGPYLSHLTATRTSPLFTTYAAPLQRSEFIIDEGYRFLWSEAERGPEFGTDNGGKLCVGFKLEGEFRFSLRQFDAEPLVTASYSDVMTSTFYPFSGIRVDLGFQVYSSHLAIENLAITNERGTPVTLSVYPFLDHSDGIMQSASLLPERDGITFRHKESPDSWTTSHGVPYQEDLNDVFMIDTVADAFGGYKEAGTMSAAGIGSSRSPTANYCVEWGKVYHPDGSECWHHVPEAQQTVRRAGSMAEILTEMAPKWGDPDPNIPGNGYQGCELGNLMKPPIAPGDTFVVTFRCAATGSKGTSSGVVPSLPAPGGVYVEVHCVPEIGPAIPQNVAIAIAPDSLAANLSWSTMAGCRFMVYRRGATSPGRYDLVADDIMQPGYSDTAFRPDSGFAYVVVAKDSTGKMSGHSSEVSGPAGRTFFADVVFRKLSSLIPAGDLKVVALQRDLTIAAGQTSTVRLMRGVSAVGSDPGALAGECRALRAVDIHAAIAEDEAAYNAIPVLSHATAEEQMMYWSAFSMMRQCMLPPEGKCSFNYNVYSREPTWGWGHAGQVFHENLSMLAYCFMDPYSAQASQRIFAERMSSQASWPAGYVPYRIGPYLDEVNELSGEFTSSAPWFNYENWEIFKVSGDTSFLRAMYPKGIAFYNFWVNDRDDDRDSLCEWGGHAFWESVRDYNVIWDLLGGWSDPHCANNVEALDLNCELVMEARSLSAMAGALGKTDEARSWMQEAESRAARINRYMWDPVTRFYYHVSKDSHTFNFQNPDDLKRKEQIGLLPLWAGVAGAEQASSLVLEVGDSATFCRPFGIPLLAHNDPYGGYDAHSVYPEWDFLVFEGLLAGGYTAEARALADRLFAGVIQTLGDYHDFYESYFCDERRPSDSWLHTYIWTGVVARMLIDLDRIGPQHIREASQDGPETFALEQNYPNPVNPATTIGYRVQGSGYGVVTLKVFDVLGREVATLVNEKKAPGRYEVRFDASRLASGVYFYRLGTPKFVQTKKFVVVR